MRVSLGMYLRQVASEVERHGSQACEAPAPQEKPRVQLNAVEPQLKASRPR